MDTKQTVAFKNHPDIKRTSSPCELLYSRPNFLSNGQRLMRLHLSKLAVSLVVIFFSAYASSAIDVYEFKSEIDRKRYQSFVDEMRCPKCQNQNLSGSDSPIATDLRREVYLMIEAGKSDKEIVDFMVERYGEFILYRPRLTSSTIFLWGAPVLLLIAGIILLLLIVRKRRTAESASAEISLSADEQARLAGLLKTSAATKSNKQENI